MTDDRFGVAERRSKERMYAAARSVENEASDIKKGMGLDAKQALGAMVAETRSDTAALDSEIGRERGLPEDWLSQVGAAPPAVSTHRRLSIHERMLQVLLRTVVRLADLCVTVARQPDAKKFKQRCALAGISVCRDVVSLLRRLADSGRAKPCRCCGTPTRICKT